MKNMEPIDRISKEESLPKKPKGYYTLKQGADKVQKVPKDINAPTRYYFKGENPPIICNCYGPDEVRALTAEDEKVLCQTYKHYKPQFLKEPPISKEDNKKSTSSPKKKATLNINLDKKLGKSIKNPINIKSSSKGEYRKSHNWMPPFRKREDVGKLVAYDTETTGTFPEGRDELLQITILNEDGKTLLDTYVKPYKLKSWDEAMAVNHITPEMVENAPYPHEIAPIVRDIFMSADEILGYNVLFDNRVVTHCLGLDINGKTEVDPLKGFRSVKTPTGHHKLGDAVEYYCPEAITEYSEGAHDAATDIKATLAVYHAFMGKREQIIEDILSNFKTELKGCKTHDDIKNIVAEFKKKNPVSLQDEEIRGKIKNIFADVKKYMQAKKYLGDSISQISHPEEKDDDMER